jgi:PAS domain S-box-containing protein
MPPPPLRIRTSLKRKLLMPLLLTGGLVAVCAVLAIRATARQQLTDKLRQRAEVVANTVNYAAEAVGGRSELQRIVAAIGAEKEVTLIVVVGGEPSRVLATTRREWLGQLLTELPVADVAEDIDEAIRTKTAHHHFHPGHNEMDFTSPLLLSQPDLAGQSLANGAVMVHLDAGPTLAEIRASSVNFSLGFLAALGILTALGYWLLEKHVMRPLLAIGRHLEKYREGDVGEWKNLSTDDELGTFARALRDSLARTDEALREVNHQKTALDEHAIVAVTDAQGRITYANDRFCAISKYSREELIGRDHRILSSGHHTGEYFRNLWATIGRGQVWRGEICNKAKDGTLYWVDATIVPFLNRDGKPERYIAIRTDISQRKRAQFEILAFVEANDCANDRLRFSLKQAEKLREEANAASRAKSEFLAMMSHEIRTPMNGVIGFTNLLLDSPLDEEQQSFAITIKNSGEALLAIINDILDFSKIEAGKLTVERVPFDFHYVSCEVIKLMTARAVEKGIALTLDYAADLPRHLVSDPSRLRQVLLNLVGNAVKFTPEKGAVSIRITAAAAGVRQLRVAVTDTGIGIPKDKQGLLFNKFTQADSSTTRKFGGTGLGLAISKSLVEILDGQIGLESEEGKGSTFWFTVPVPDTVPAPELPRAEAVKPGAPSVSASRSQSLRGRSILVAEDTAANQLLVRKLLEKLGCQVTIAPNGQVAADLFREHHYDAVLMDCHMPVLDGFEATEQVRQFEVSRSRDKARTPIIALTADAMEGDRRKCIEGGMDDYLSKPIRPGELEAMLVKWTTDASPLLAP